MRRRRGVAMVVVLAMVIIFSSLALAVVLTASMSIRRAYAFRNQSIAVNLAELGVADALYRLNYRYHDNAHYYGFDDTGECLKARPSVGDVCRYELRAGDLGYAQATRADRVTVSLLITGMVNSDTLLAEARYRGRRAVVSCSLRTTSTEANLALPLAPLDYTTSYDTKGVPEAFNKHVLYARAVTGSSTTISGNITADTGVVTTWPSSSWTKGVTNLPLFALPAPFPGEPALYADEYDSGGNRNGVPLPGNDGVWWDAAGEVYHFGTNDGLTPAAYTRTTNAVHIAGAGARIRFGARIGNYFRVDDDVRIDSAVFINPGQSCVDCGEVTFSAGAHVDGDLTVKRSAAGPLLLSSPNLIFAGALVCDQDVDISGANITFDLSRGSTREAAILISSAVGRNLTITASPGISLGPDQRSAMIVYTPTAVSTVTIAAAVTPAYADVHQSAVVLYGSSGSLLSITAPVTGLVYSGGSVSLGVGAQVTGAVVANYGGGAVTLHGGELSYDASAFRSLTEPEIFKGFVGGRRVYLPVPGSWRVR